MTRIETKPSFETLLVKLSNNEQLLISDLGEIVDDSNSHAIIKGGFVRDKISNSIRGTNLIPNDIDVFVSRNIHNVVSTALSKGYKIIERRARKKTPVFKLQSPNTKYDLEIGIIRANPYLYDLSPTFDQLVQEEALSSDLGVNALSIRLSKKLPFCLYDSFNATEQLESGVLSISNTRCFHTNPETPLRIIRIVNKLDCQLDKQGQEYLRDHNYVASRMQEWFAISQILKLLENENTMEKNWRMMISYGYADILVPDLANLSATEVQKILIQNE